ncbi:alpha/beta fold hydrolase [Corallococcus terminator]|uniref:Alpha/beta fold hydrolase n=1 Tax=Corallococcus terminator TaxID=2316733 RepID=A0A3A8JBQ7_9BACT|nr:alpha/beta fold hydrolase [Corallococcus terminator]RKG92346.1 alpha/beta fold hydrolase [Corallococcus terminator]
MRAVLLLCLILPLSLAQAQSLQLQPYAFQARDGRSVQAELGTVTVPLRHARPEGPGLPLRFVRFKSTSPSPAAPIVYLAGGPGGSGIEAARNVRFELFLALREVADVIALDQRGTGQSDPHPDLEQRWAIPLEQRMDEALLTTTVKKAAAEASRTWATAGVDLGAYTTEESADDLEVLRKALGAPKLNLWGISYGTHLGLAYLRRHGQRVDHAILAGIEGPDDTWKRPAHAEALLERWEVVLRAEGERGPGLRPRLAKLLKSLKREPRTVALTDPAKGERHTWRVSHFDLQRATFESLRDPATFRRFLTLLPALEAGDYAPLAPFARQLREGWLGPMSLAMDAASGVSPARHALIQREAAKALLGGSANPGALRAGDVPGVGDLGESFRGPLKAEVPVLLISGTLDGRTSPDNAEALRPGLSQAAHLVLVGAGHDGLFQSDPRILERMKAFLKGEALRDERLEVKAKP